MVGDSRPSRTHDHLPARPRSGLPRANDTAHWLKVIKDADCPGGPVHSYETLFDDPEVVANDSFTTYEHPQAGPVRTPTPGWRFSETPARVARRPPLLGEHTEEVLREAGFARTADRRTAQRQGNQLVSARTDGFLVESTLQVILRSLATKNLESKSIARIEILRFAQNDGYCAAKIILGAPLINPYEPEDI